MRICIFPCSDKGGIDTYTTGLAKALHEKTDHEVYALGDVKIPTRKGKVPLIDMHEIGSKLGKVPYLGYTILPTVEFGYRLSRLFHKMKFDLIHSASPLSFAFCNVSTPLILTAWFYPSSLAGGVRVMEKFCNLWKFPFMAIARLPASIGDIMAYKKARKIICATKDLRRDLLNRGHDAVYIPPAIEPLRIKSEKSDRLTLTFVSHDLTHKRKGLEYLMGALVEVKKELAGESFVLNLIGNPKKKLSDMVRRYGLEENVSVLGALPKKKTLLTISKSHVLVVPSLYEEFGYVALESMMLGVPVVASDTHSFRDLISDDVGVLVDVTNKKKFAEKLLLLMRDKRLRKKLGSNARKKVEKEFSWKAVLPRILELYDLA